MTTGNTFLKSRRFKNSVGAKMPESTSWTQRCYPSTHHTTTAFYNAPCASRTFQTSHSRPSETDVSPRNGARVAVQLQLQNHPAMFTNCSWTHASPTTPSQPQGQPRDIDQPPSPLCPDHKLVHKRWPGRHARRTLSSACSSPS